MPQRCNQDMVRRLLALVPVLVVVGCVGGSHEGHGGMSRPHSPPSAPSPAVASGAARPGQLHGVPLTGTTGLVLLVSADPPYLLDVDTGRVTPVKGLGVQGPAPVLSVLATGRDAVVWIDRRPLASGLPDEHVLDQRRPPGDARADARRRPGQPRRHHRLAARPEKPRDPIRAHTGSRQRQRQLRSLAQRPDGTSRVLVGLVRTTPAANQAE
jgi:hypothetical protein